MNWDTIPVLEKKGETMDRRAFLAAVSAASLAAPALAAEPERHPAGEPHMKRFDEERWALDNVIQANGMDWDQPHRAVLLGSCGLAVQGDLAALGSRIKKLADFTPAFEAVAQKRQKLAEEAKAAGERIPARDNFYIAAAYWGSAQWLIDEANAQNKSYNDKKRAAFSAYMDLADHHIEWVEIPYRGKTLPGIFHLPRGYQAGTKVPAIVAVPGMDGFKERSVALYADGWMERGVAVFAIEGPGYWEAPLRGLYVDVPGWAETGKAVMDWLAARPEIDVAKVGMTGSSFGSFFSAIMMSDEPRYQACAVSGTCYEPQGRRIFDEASPTFKRRFMFMSGITDESEFEAFRKTIDWHGYAEKIKAPYLVVAGGSDELCPMEATEDFMRALGGPKQLLVYQDSRHGVGGVPSVTNGPEPRTLMAEWLIARLGGKPFASERWLVEPSGQVIKTAV
jgi:alpha-beta hydrolase superfamily lysophospholipase